MNAGQRKHVVLTVLRIECFLKEREMAVYKMLFGPLCYMEVNT